MAAKEDLIRVFEDTERMYQEDERLKEAIKSSIEGTRFYPEGQTPAIPTPRYEKTTVTVTKYRTLETAMFYHRKFPELRIAAHNFRIVCASIGAIQLVPAVRHEDGEPVKRPVISVELRYDAPRRRRKRNADYQRSKQVFHCSSLLMPYLLFTYSILPQHL